MLFIIYWALDLSQGHLHDGESQGEDRPVLGLFKGSWLDLGASLTGSCRVRTDRLRVSMRFMGPEEGRVVTVSKTLGPSLVGIFTAGLPHLMLLPHLRVEAKWQKAVAKMSIVAHKEVGSPWGCLLIWVSLGFYIFPCIWKVLPPRLP
jgi:hypothetical protein